MYRRFLVLLTLCLMVPQLALAQYGAGNRPLIIFRFNQPNVAYEQSLADALSRAQAAKPGVMFDVMSYAPATGNPQMDAAWEQTSGHNTQAVVASMQRMGVPMNRIRVNGQHQQGIAYDEVHIYVR